MDINFMKTITNTCQKAEDVYSLIIMKNIIKNRMDLDNLMYLNNLTRSILKQYSNCLTNKTSEDIIAEINKDLIFENSEINKDNYSEKFYTILGKLYDRLKSLIEEKELWYLMSVLSMLELNRFLAAGVYLWSKKEEIKNDNCLLMLIINFLETTNNLKDGETFLFLDEFFSIDKNALECIFPIIYKQYHDKHNLMNKKNYSISDIQIGMLLEISKSILKIFALIDEYKKGDYRNKKLKIDSNGYFIYPAISKKDKSEYYEYVLKNHNENDLDFIHQIDKAIEPLIGISSSNIEKLMKSSQYFDELKDNEFIVEKKESFIEKMVECCNIDKKSLNKIINYITYKVPQTYLDGKTHLDDKITRKGLINIENILIIPLNLLRVCLVNIYTDILSNQIENKTIKEKLEKAYSTNDENFEKEIYKMCKNELEYSYIAKNIQQKAISFAKDTVELPGEIDILLLYKEILFVIECKNIATRTTVDTINSMRRELDSSYKTTSFQTKLLNKIKVLHENINIVSKYMKVNGNIKKVTGCIVTSGFYLQSKRKNSLCDVVTKEKLIDWIKKKCENNN